MLYLLFYLLLYWILSFVLWLFAFPGCWLVRFFFERSKKKEPKKKTAGCHYEATPSHLWTKTNKRPRFAHLNVFVS